MRIAIRRRMRGPVSSELSDRRKARGWTQRQLAEAANVGRTAVQYWERAGRLDPGVWAVKRMAAALDWQLPSLPAPDGFHDPLLSQICTLFRGVGPLSEAMTSLGERSVHAGNVVESDSSPTRRVVCGAKTRRNTKCRNKSEPGKLRCKFHGGTSTGARTPEGIERIRQAQRRRWAKERQERQGE